jgi:peroxygenase
VKIKYTNLYISDIASLQLISIHFHLILTSTIANMPSSSLTNGTSAITHSIASVPVTTQRQPFCNPPNTALPNAGEARANLAPSFQTPDGTTSGDWATKHAHQTVLQQHIDFFDRDHDGMYALLHCSQSVINETVPGIIYPHDTFIGFRRLGFNLFLSLFSAFIIHLFFSYPTLPTLLPSPLFPIYLSNIHHAKHGSDTGTYDSEGRFVPQKFEDVFAKYAGGREYLTLSDVARVWSGQRVLADPVGWGGAVFEWAATWILLWPEDGRMMKEDIRGIYDGSLFYRVAEKRERKR